MEIINKNNLSITNEELEKLYLIYYDNVSSDDIKYVNNDKEEWINEIKSFSNTNYYLFYDNNYLIGYIIIYPKDDSNYIREFEIIKNYQNDGKTFIDMIRMTLPYTDTNKAYEGRILSYNDTAKMSFKRVGALVNNGMFVCTYDRLIKMLHTDTTMFRKKSPPKKKNSSIKKVQRK